MTEVTPYSKTDTSTTNRLHFTLEEVSDDLSYDEHLYDPDEHMMEDELVVDEDGNDSAVDNIGAQGLTA